MKKIIIVIAVFCSFATVVLAQTPQYYNYNTMGGANSFPFAVTGGKQIQWLVRAGEFIQPSSIPSGKSITKIYFYMAGSGTASFYYLKISLGQTTQTSLPANVIYTGPMTMVYFKQLVTLSSTAGNWMGITLDKSFPYDTSLSLVIDVSHYGSTGSTIMTLNQTYLTGRRRCYNNDAGNCYYIYSGQDSSVANCGVDVIPTPGCVYYWGAQNSGTTNLLNSVKAVSNLIGWTAGAGATIRRTIDGGITWTNGNPGPGVITDNIYSIDAMNYDTAWCTASSSSQTYIYRTANGGVNWTQVFTQAGGFINAIHFISSYFGYAVGNPVNGRWTLWYSGNGGVTWDSLNNLLQNGNESGWNNSMAFIGNFGWFGTNNSRAYNAVNPICSWSFAPTTGLLNSMSLHFNSNTLGLVGGSTMLRTTDGGLTWSGIGIVPGTGNIYGIEGTGTDFWYIRGPDVYRSSNSGDNWTHIYTASGNLNHINFALINSCPEGWAVGAGGTIIKMSKDSLVGARNNSKQIPIAYSLEQNYPNPFNSSTIIKYDLKEDVQVSIKVYDILGRLVKTLIFDFQNAGFKSINWDGKNDNGQFVASGLYFCKITAGDFKDVKKFILIK